MRPSLIFSLACFCAIQAFGHDGPDPIAHWQFNEKNLSEKKLKSRLGPDATFTGKPTLIKDPLGQSVRFNGRGVECVVANNFAEVKEHLPTQAMTISAWVAIDEPVEWGGLIGAMQDNGGHEKGWVLGYTNTANFSFALSTQGADDGDGLMTYLKGRTKFELGKIYHVVATYDGKEMQLFVNGKLDGSSDVQSGDILYPKAAPFVIGAYRDSNEFYPFKGRIREIELFDIAAKPKWVAEEFEHHQDIAKLPKLIREDQKSFVVAPYLQYGTQTGMTVMWRAAKEGPGVVHWGENARCKNRVESEEQKRIQEVRIEGLKPETQYFYWVESVDSEGNVIESDVKTFQTASKPETPFAFAVISDTQGNPKVNGAIAKLAWAHRPNFLLHPGDLVDQGRMGDDWIDEFFASMNP